jgi:hypothetical protein
MRKIKGYDIFALACRNSIAVIGFKNDRFILLRYLNAIYNSLIFEISIYGNYMIPVCIGKREKIRVIEFGDDKVDSLLKSREFDPNGLMNKKGRLLTNVFTN